MTIVRSLDNEARFKVRSARADIDSAAEVPEVLRFCREHAIVFLVARCPVSEVRAVHALEDEGLRMMDTLVSSYRTLEDWVPPPPNDTDIGPLQSSDVGIIEAIASDAFRNYRGHYHADPHLDPVSCDNVYVDWATRCLSPEYADVVLLARIANTPAGFMAMRVRSEQGVLMLGGISHAYTSRGVFRSLSTISSPAPPLSVTAQPRRSDLGEPRRSGRIRISIR